MELEFSDYDGKPVGTCTKITSANYAPKLCGTGNSEYHLSARSEITSVILSQPFLLVKEGGKMSVIIGHEIDDSGSTIAVYGRTLSFFTEKTVVEAFSLTNATAYDAIKRALECSHGVPFTLTENDGAFAEEKDYTLSEPVTLSQFLGTVLTPLHSGYEVTFADGVLTLLLIAPNVKTRAVSVANGTATTVKRTYDLLERACACIKNENGTYVCVGTEDAVPLRNWYAPCESDQLSNQKINDLLTATVSRMQYGTDYALGDIFPVQFETDTNLLTFPAQIVSVTIDYDSDGYRETPNFEQIGE